jgi:glyoxylase I family protein
LVEGLAEALFFYETVLGCEVETRLPHLAMVELRAGTARIDLVDIGAEEGAWARPPVDGGRNVDHVALAIESREAKTLRAHLVAHGVAIADERVEGESTSFYVRDPSRNTIELIARARETDA